MKETHYGFIYIWYDRKHKRYYIGSHWGLENDGYICSSNWMRDSRKRRPQDFKRRVIERHNSISYVGLLEREHCWLDLIKDEELGVRYYNLHKTRNHWMTCDNRKSIGQKISQTKIERGVHAGANHWNYGKHHSEETKRKIGEKSKGRRSTLGKPMSEETKRKISATLGGRKLTQEWKEKIRRGHWLYNPNITEERREELKKTLFQKRKTIN